MLIPTRLLKQSPELFTAERARAALEAQPQAPPPPLVHDRSSSGGPVRSAAGAKAGSPPLGHEREFVARLKRVSIALLGQASAAYGEGLKDEQEVLAQIADVITEVYASESAIARAEKMAARGDRRAGVATDIAQVYTHDAADKVAAAARQVVAALAARRADSGVAEGVERLASYGGIDAIAARRRIANAVIEAGRYPL
jgi:hypothetical protein